MKKRLTEDIETLHRKSRIVIGYMNPACRFLPDGGIDYAPFFTHTSWSQGTVPRLHKGGVDVAVVSFGINNPDLFPGLEGVTRVFKQLGTFIAAAHAHADKVEVAHTTADIRRIRKQGKIALLLHLTGVRLDGDIGLLKAYYAMGVRSIHPPFDSMSDQHVNAWDKGSALTAFGRTVVREMQTLGMTVDLAHASDRMFHNVLRITEGPIIVSHGTCRSINPSKRNMTDKQIQALARRGGVIGVHFAGQLIDAQHLQQRNITAFSKELKDWEQAVRRKHPQRFDYLVHRYNYQAWTKTRAYQIQQSIPLPSLDRLLDHVDHIVHLVGIDHVGIGADYDLGNIPKAIDRADKLTNLTQALRERGYAKRDIRKIWGDNFMRAFRQVLDSGA